MAEETTPVTFNVNGKTYQAPTAEDLTLGEMCDAERYFGVEFGENASTGMRMMAAMLWIAIRRDDPSVTVEDIRMLPLDVFSGMGDVGPPEVSETSLSPVEQPEDSGDNSSPNGDVQEDALSRIGSPG